MCIHHLWVQNHVKLKKKKKKSVFFVIFTNLGKDMTKNEEEEEKKNMQKHIIRVYFHSWKIHTEGKI